MIELKTEAGSHRPAQIPLYFELGRHHYPRHRIDITYLTGPVSTGLHQFRTAAASGTSPGAEVMPLIRDVWADRSPLHRDVVRALGDVLDGLGTKWSAWRADRIEAGPSSICRRRTLPATHLRLPVSPRSITSNAPSTSPRANLENLQALRLEVLHRIKASGDAALHVAPWLWRWASQGQPLTSAGRETGYELRLSWYQKPAV